MGNNRPVKTKDWIEFLLAHGCEKKGLLPHILILNAQIA